MAWIQGAGGYWYRNPKWWTGKFMLSTEELDGEMVGRCYGKGRYMKLRLEEVGFIDPVISPTLCVGLITDRQNAFCVTPTRPVPLPDKNDGRIMTYLYETEFSGEAVVRFAILISEGEARGLWGPAAMASPLLDWFGGKGRAKRILRRVFNLLDKNPFHYPTMTQGSILVTQRGVRV